jgi:hypothetical protein
MRKNIVLSVVVLLLLLFAYGLGYRSGFFHARKGVRVVVAGDTSDSHQSSGKTEHEPYFTKQNPILDRVR